MLESVRRAMMIFVARRYRAKPFFRFRFWRGVPSETENTLKTVFRRISIEFFYIFFVFLRFSPVRGWVSSRGERTTGTENRRLRAVFWGIVWNFHRNGDFFPYSCGVISYVFPYWFYLKPRSKSVVVVETVKAGIFRCGKINFSRTTFYESDI